MTAELKYTDVMRPEDINIAHLWVIFAGAVLPVGASQGQREDMRRAFYAGFVECFKIFTDIASSLPEVHATQVLDGINREAKAFFEEMKRRHGL
jgi:hypothetical protein